MTKTQIKQEKYNKRMAAKTVMASKHNHWSSKSPVELAFMSDDDHKEAAESIEMTNKEKLFNYAGDTLRFLRSQVSSDISAHAMFGNNAHAIYKTYAGIIAVYKNRKENEEFATMDGNFNLTADDLVLCKTISDVVEISMTTASSTKNLLSNLNNAIGMFDKYSRIP
jgi:hypothetical protein